MRRVFRHVFLFCILVSALVAQQGDRKGEAQAPVPEHIAVPPAPVRSAEEELATFTLAPGFRAELVAADPLVGDPVAAQFGPDGRLWVVEMRGFMPNADGIGEREPVGVVATLEDADGDGRFDRRTVFADQLVMPRALSLVDDGVLVAEPPHLWFLRDTDGDGAADEKTEVASDYGGINNPEHTANGLLWALDNWIYSANHTTRFRYEGGGRFRREVTIARGQWGIAQDDLGRIYYNSNSDPLRVDLIPAEYLRRNPNFAAAGANVQVVPARALRLWPARVTTGVNRGYQNLDAGGKLRAVTATGGPVIYRGTLFPEELRGDAFITEPSANLVKRIKLTEEDGVVRGANAYQEFEFMASTDERFRPVNLLNGPDGALYVVDLYRGILQHRIYLTTFLRKQIEERGLDKGTGLGRIWRIVPEGAPPARFDRGLAQATGAELVAKLRDASGWVRDTAQRMLVARTRADEDTVAALRALALDRDATATARRHALWTLDGIGALDAAVVREALDARDAELLATAVRLSERFVGGAGRSGGNLSANEKATGRQDAGAALIDRVIALVGRRDEPKLRLQLALTLGEFGTAAADAALRDLVIAAGKQPYLADAAVSGIAGREVEFIDALVRDPRAPGEAGEAVRFAASAVLKSGEPARIERVLALVSPATPGWAREAMLGGVRHFLPKSPQGKTLPGNLPVEPKPLLALAAQADTPDGKSAELLLRDLTWPGKPGTGEAAARPLTAEEEKRFAAGEAQFAALCAACHQPNGQGLPGLAPSLVHSKWVLGDAEILARIVLNGKARENMAMPPWKGALDDAAIAGVLTFMRRAWGHAADPVSPEVVARARTATARREEPFSEAELEALAETLRSR